MNEKILIEISKQGPAVVVVALFLFAIYMIARMVVEGMKGYTKTQEKLILQLSSFASTIEKQTAMLEKQTKMIQKQSGIISKLSGIITELKGVIQQMYVELLNKSKMIQEYEAKSKKS